MHSKHSNIIIRITFFSIFFVFVLVFYYGYKIENKISLFNVDALTDWITNEILPNLVKHEVSDNEGHAL